MFVYGCLKDTVMELFLLCGVCFIDSVRFLSSVYSAVALLAFRPSFLNKLELN